MKKNTEFRKKNSLKINQVRSPMFLMERQEFKDYLSKNKRPFMANFYKIVRTKMNLLMNKNGTPKGINGVSMKKIEKNFLILLKFLQFLK